MRLLLLLGEVGTVNHQFVGMINDKLQIAALIGGSESTDHTESIKVKTTFDRGKGCCNPATFLSFPWHQNVWFKFKIYIIKLK